MNLFNDWVAGELVGALDENNENNAVLDRLQLALQTLFGVDHLSPPHGEPGFGPHLGLSAGLAGFTVSVAANIPLLVWGRIVLTQAFSVALAPNVSGDVRTDVLIATLSEGPVNPFVRAVRQPPVGEAPGIIVPTTCYQRDASVVFSLVQGAGGAGSNSALSSSLGPGQVAAVRIDVPPGTVPIASNVTILIPSVPDILKKMGITGPPGAQGVPGIPGPIGPQGAPGNNAIGFSTARQMRLPSDVNSLPLKNPPRAALGPLNPLPGVGLTYDLYARATYDIRDFGVGYMKLTGSGASWEAPQRFNAPAAGEITGYLGNGQNLVELMGTAVSGQQPSVQLEIVSTVTAPLYAGVFRFVATLRN